MKYFCRLYRNSCDVLKYFKNDKNCYMLLKELSKRSFKKHLLHICKLWSVTNDPKTSANASPAVS